MKKRMLSLILAAVLVCAVAVPAGAERVPLEKVSDASGTVIDANGDLWEWGLGYLEPIDGYSWPFYRRPTKVMSGVAKVCYVSYSGDGYKPYGAILKTDGTLWMMGDNTSGQLGDGTTLKSDEWIKIMDGVADVVTSGGTTTALKTDGTLWTWGKNKFGILGNGTTSQSLIPVKILDNVVAMDQGTAVKCDGTLWRWGGNFYGQLGNGYRGNESNQGYPYQTIPTKVADHVVDVAGNFFLKDDGTMWGSGTSYHLDRDGVKMTPELGIGWDKGNRMVGDGWGGTYYIQDTPVKIMDHVAAIGKGSAITTDGTLYRWGCDVGNGAEHNEWIPKPVAVMRNVTAYEQDLVIKQDGTVWTLLDNWQQEGDVFTVNETPYSNETRTTFEKVDGAPKMIGVRFVLNGGMGTTLSWLKSGQTTLDVPQNPTRKGYTFAGWYTDEELTKPYNFNDKVTKGFTLFAKWVPVSSTAATTGKSQSVISLNGNTVTLDAYTLKGANGGDVTYVKLRDVAALLENTSVKFNVDWKRGAIYVASKSAYTTKNGTELKAISGTDGSYKWNQAPVLFDGTTKALEGIVLTDGKGGGHTFFKLRDLGEALGFTVGWSAERGIFIETK